MTVHVMADKHAACGEPPAGRGSQGDFHTGNRVDLTGPEGAITPRAMHHDATAMMGKSVGMGKRSTKGQIVLKRDRKLEVVYRAMPPQSSIEELSLSRFLSGMMCL